jgi:hypothetical protein
MKKTLTIALLMFAATANAQFINQNISATGPNNAFGLAFGVDRTVGPGLTVGQLLRTSTQSTTSPLSVSLIAETWVQPTGVAELVGVKSHVLNKNAGNYARKSAFAARFTGAFEACSSSPMPPPSNGNSVVLYVEPGDETCVEPFATLIDLSGMTLPHVAQMNLILFPDGKALRYDPATQKLVVVTP